MRFQKITKQILDEEYPESWEKVRKEIEEIIIDGKSFELKEVVSNQEDKESKDSSC